MTDPQPQRFAKDPDGRIGPIRKKTRRPLAEVEPAPGPDGVLARRMREQSVAPGDARDESDEANATPVEKHIQDMVAGATRRDNIRRFQGAIIGVEAGDGMSAVAASAARVAQGAGLRTVVFAANGSAADIETLIELVGLSNAVKAAREAGIVSRPRTISRARSAAVAVAALVVGVAVAIVNAVSGGGIASSVIWPAAVVAVVLAGLGGATTVLKRLAAENQIDVQDLAARIRDGVEEDRHVDFVADLVGALDRTATRDCVVIDDYVRLHPVAKLFVDEYLDRRIQPNRTELWIIVARHEPGHVSRIWASASGLKRGTQGTRVHALKRFELVRLTGAEREQLARLVGHPERRGLRTVSQICAGLDDDDVAPFCALVDEKFARDATAMGVLQLLALTATAGANLRWEHDLLRSTLSGGGNTRRARVLAAMIPDATSTRIEGVLQDLRKELGDYLGVGPNPLHSVQLRADAAHAIVKNPAMWTLPPDGLGHLFWALFWHDLREHHSVDALYVDKTAQHLLRASFPGRYEERLGGATKGLIEQALNVTIATIDNALSCCCLADLEDLLELALDLSRGDSGKDRDNRRRRLRRLAWAAYAVLGSDRVLDAVLAIDALLDRNAASTTTPRRGSAGQRVYFASLGRSGDTAVPRTQSGMRDSVTELNLSLNGAWLCLTADPLLDGLPGPLRDGAGEAFRELPALVDDLLDSEQEREDSWDELDHLAMSMGLWCWALTGKFSNRPEWGMPDAERIAGALDGCVYALAGQEQIRRESGGRDRAEFVVDGLGQDLLLALAASTLVALRTWFAVQVEDNRQRLLDVLRHCAGQLALALPPEADEEQNPEAWLTAVATAVLDRMELLRGVFNSLGFTQLAANLALRRVQLAGLVAPSTEAALRPTLALHDQLARRDRVGLLARLIAASVERSANISVNTLLAGVGLAIETCRDDDLVVELCRLTVRAGSSFDVAWETLLEHLLEEDDEGESHLSRVIGACPPDRLVGAALGYLNISRTDPNRFATVAAILRRRVEQLDDAEIARNVSILVEAHEIQSRTASGVPNDVGAVLDEWLPHRDNPSFPFLLECLASDRGALRDGRLSDAILAVAANHRQYFTKTGIVLLLWGLHVRRHELPDELQHYLVEGGWAADLRECIGPLESSLSPELNFQIYRHLAQVDDDAHSDSSRARMTHWHAKELELEEAERLNQMISEGRYARLLTYWTNVLSVYGLREFNEPEDGALPERWLTQRQLIKHYGSTPAVSAQFLRDVVTAFDTEGKDPALDETRRQLDEQARANLPRLFETMKSLSDVPQPIRSIVRRHQRLVTDRIAQGHGQLVSTS